MTSPDISPDLIHELSPTQLSQLKKRLAMQERTNRAVDREERAANRCHKVGSQYLLTRAEQIEIHKTVSDPQVQVLRGAIEMAAYMRVSAGTIARWIKDRGFPAMNGCGSIKGYVTTKSLIDAWIVHGHMSRVEQMDWISKYADAPKGPPMPNLNAKYRKAA